MQDDVQKEKNMISHLKRIRWIAIAVTAIVLMSALPVGAWFYYQRSVAAVAGIDSPVALYINAGNRDDIIYLDLSDIDVEREEDIAIGKYYKDFVFCVNGEYLSNYYLQLGYTTNNQFDYYIYFAQDGTSSDYDVAYVDVESNIHYYKRDGSALEGYFLNKKAGTEATHEVLGDPNASNEYFIGTYGNYTYVNKYAVPLYWKTTDPIEGNGEGDFYRYFILRVDWTRAVQEPINKHNDRETDIIYIAAGQ